MLVFALLAVFVAGLMVGRTPEFLGKKIRGPQMKLIVAYVLTIPVVTLVLGSISLVIPAGTSAILNPGFHGLSEVTYAFASVTNNNGSAFAGLAANTTWYNTTLALAMLIGRFVPIVLALAIAGSLAGARVHARTRATLDTTGPTFVVFLVGVIVIVGGSLLAHAHPGPDWRTHRRVAVLAERKAKSSSVERPVLGLDGPTCFLYGTTALTFETGHACFAQSPVLSLPGLGMTPCSRPLRPWSSIDDGTGICGSTGTTADYQDADSAARRRSYRRLTICSHLTSDRRAQRTVARIRDLPRRPSQKEEWATGSEDATLERGAGPPISWWALSKFGQCLVQLKYDDVAAPEKTPLFAVSFPGYQFAQGQRGVPVPLTPSGSGRWRLAGRCPGDTRFPTWPALPSDRSPCGVPAAPPSPCRAGNIRTLGPVRVLRALDRYEDRPQHLRARDRGRERPEGPSLAIRASTSGLRASKSGDITFSCGCLLILKHHTLRAALSSVLNPGGSERR